LGERLLCKQEVIGSIPFTSTLLRADVLRSASPAQREAGLLAREIKRERIRCAGAWFSNQGCFDL
jgi:hypothetical protein